MLEGANELRLMLCKEKRNPSTGAVGQSVVAACGAGAASCLPRQLTDRRDAGERRHCMQEAHRDPPCILAAIVQHEVLHSKSRAP